MILSSIYQRIFELAPDCYLVLDAQQQIVLVNPAFSRAFGYERGEVIGRQFSSFFAEQDQRVSTGEGERPSQKPAQPESARLSAMRRRDGTVFHAVVTGPLAPDDRTDSEWSLWCIRPAAGELNGQRRPKTDPESIDLLREAIRRGNCWPMLLNQIQEGFGAEAGALVHFGSSGMRVEFAVGLWQSCTGRDLDLPRPDVRAKIETGRVFTSTFDTSALDGGAHFPFEKRTLAMAVVPIAFENRVPSGLWLGRAREFAPDELQLLMAMADLLSSTMRPRRINVIPAWDAGHLLERLHGISTDLLSGGESSDTLDEILEMAVRESGVDAAAVLKRPAGSTGLTYASVRGFHNGNPKPGEMVAIRGVLNTVMESRQQVYLAGPELTELNPFHTDLAVEEGFQAALYLPLVGDGQTLGVLELYSRAVSRSFFATPSWIDDAAAQCTFALQFDSLLKELFERPPVRNVGRESRSASSARADRPEVSAPSHSKAWMLETVTRLAVALTLDRSEIRHMRRGVLLHDIGEVAVPARIRSKPGRLTADEWEILRRHPVYAHELLSRIPLLRPARVIPYGHHERWDGTGYPQGLRGEEIPLAARIFAVVDVWDAMHSERPHRGPIPEPEITRSLHQNAGRLFDAKVVELFFDLL